MARSSKTISEQGAEAAVNAKTNSVSGRNDTVNAQLVSKAAIDMSTSAAEALERVREILSAARLQAAMAVNVAMVRAYWQVGREIVEEELRGRNRADYGAQLLEILSLQLTREFGRGFDRSNLTNIRNFYVAFPKFDALRQELTWTHYRQLSRVRDNDTRQFYLTECIRAHWSTRELERQVSSFLYERVAASRDKEGVLRLAEKGAEALTAQDILRDPYVLEFSGLPESIQWQESDLEQALMDRLQQFLLELGTDLFSFHDKSAYTSTETISTLISSFTIESYAASCSLISKLASSRNKIWDRCCCTRAITNLTR